MMVYEGKNIVDYDDIEEIQSHTTLWGSYYRGLSSTKHTLLPSLTREIRNAENAMKAEQYIWERITTNKTICDFFKYPIEGKTRRQEWELALLCRHSGILSRIMDFTPTTKIACWFASIENEDEDGVLWEMTMPEQIRYRAPYEDFPLPCEMDGTKFFRSTIIGRGEDTFISKAERNVLYQNSFSFVQSMENAVVPLEKQNINKIKLIRYRIPAISKRIIINEMKNFEVARKYPDFVYAEDDIIKNEIDKINAEVREQFA